VNAPQPKPAQSAWETMGPLDRLDAAHRKVAMREATLAKRG
jgi:hypothetical protein